MNRITIKAWNRDNGTEFYELVHDGFAIGHAFNESAAQAFASVPELLHACELMVALGSELVDMDGLLTFGPAYEAATKALAKAKGETK